MAVDDFQYTVQELLVQNKSILDLLTKFQETGAAVNRAIIKSVTRCGCIRINAKKQEFPPDGDLKGMKDSMKSHVEGKLCNNCRDSIEKELGSNFFYMAAVCNTLDLNMYDILLKEEERVKVLGDYNMR